MRDEDLDWMVYHLIVERGSAGGDELAETVGCDPEEIESSLLRLKRALLIDCSSGAARPLSIGESIFLCRMKYEKDLPFTIENGVIRAKKPEQE